MNEGNYGGYTRRDFLKTAAMGAAGLAIPFNILDAAEKEKYNILFIMSDDHAYQAISSYDNRLISTPNIDRLSKEGCRFINSFCTNSICGPSRAVLLTGKYSHKNGMIDNSTAFDGSQLTFPKLLRKAGYKTAVIGKWHLKSDPTGFDYWNILPGQGDYYNPDFIEMGKRERVEGYVTDLITDKSISWIEGLKKEEPFCLLMHHKAPHRNWMPNLKYIEEFENSDFPIPDTFFDDYKSRSDAASKSEMSISRHMSMDYDLKVELNKEDVNDPAREILFGNYWGSIYSRLNEAQRKEWERVYKKRTEEYKRLKLKGEELDKWKYRNYIKDYLRCILSVDESVGRMLNCLDSNGLSGKTLVVYTSDQGFYLGEHGWFDKRFMYEQSLRMPLLMRLPGKIKPHTDTENMVMNLDFAPTFLDYAGIKAPAEMQGYSLRPALEQNIFAESRDAVYYHYFEFPAEHMVKRHYGIRTKNFKLIHFYHDIDAWELYDLRKDKDEVNNVYGIPEYSEIISGLKDKLYRLQKKYDDTSYSKFLPKEKKKLMHKAVGLGYLLANPPSEKYKGNLTDGMVYPDGELFNVNLNGWTGIEEKDFSAEMDLSGLGNIEEIRVGFLQKSENWVFLPSSVKLEVSTGENNYRIVKQYNNPAPEKSGTPFKKSFAFRLKGKDIRKIRITGKNIGKCPQWHGNPGGKAWLFCDEIVVL